MQRPTPYALRRKSGSKESSSFEKSSKIHFPYNLPKGYLSYSAIWLWRKDKNAFRDKYYKGLPPIETPYTIFGKRIAKILETDEYKNDPTLKKIPKFGVAEHSIEVTVEGIPILGYLDRFSLHKKSFKEYKTGIVSPNGTLPWDVLKVNKHDQLPFYSYLIKLKYGKYEPLCELVWLETRWEQTKTDYIMPGGKLIELVGDSRKLTLSGKFETFKRIIKPWEHKRIKKIIIDSAKEISEDYTKYQNENNTTIKKVL